MNEIDKFYTEAVLDRHGGAYYDWERQFIELRCCVSDISLITPSTPLTAKGVKNASILIHEYIHFLQNFATNWGAPVFSDLAIAYLKIGSSSALNTEIYRLPLDEKSISNVALIAGFDSRRQVVMRLSKSDKIHEISPATIASFKVSFNNEVVSLSNGRVDVQIGMKVIRENMAHLGTHLYLGKTDLEIHEYNEKVSARAPGSIPFRTQAEYWVVFEYFYQLGCHTNVARGVFTLMQYALCTLNPDKFVYRFFNYYRTIKTGDDLVDHVTKFINTRVELTVLAKASKISIKQCSDALAICSKHRKAHDLFDFVGDILKYSLNSITTSNGGRNLFAITDVLNDFDYWRAKMVKYGTGIINYLDGTLISGTEDHCLKMEKNFANFLSCGLVLEKLLGNNILECPFLYDMKICHASQYGCDGCTRNPFLVVSSDPEAGECLFRNGFLLLGMQDRIDFT